MPPRAERFSDNPLISPEQVKPSREGWEVVSVFNCGAVVYGGEILLLARVAERPVSDNPKEIVAPRLDFSVDPPSYSVLRISREDPDLAAADPRIITYQGKTYLTSISHLRLAKSKDGRHFTVAEQPTFLPAAWYESFGVEDPRITEIDGQYLITYTAVSEYGIAAALATTADFKTFTRRGIIFPPENRDVTIFPEKIQGRYACHHRPVGHHLPALDIWAAYSPNLSHWGEHRRVMGRRPGHWDGGRIGGGAVPIKTGQGWLAIYHGADENQCYSLGAMLCDLAHPEKVLARSAEPLLTPEAPYERAGFFPNVVFTCGAMLQGDALTIYYGAADRSICGAVVSLSEVLKSLTVSPET